MFESVFKTELTALTNDAKLMETLWAEIKKHYGSSGRHYHNLNHLDHMMAELMPVQHDIEDWQLVVLCVAYHDIVYDATSEFNEENSLTLAYKRMNQLGLNEAQLMKCGMMIMATKEHEPSRNMDINYFIDADLAIMGAAEETYHQYARNIRKEFWTFPDFMYKRGRRNALQHFLNKDFIYSTIHFREQYERQARENIATELKALS